MTDRFRQLIENANHAVFLGGAGVSTESDIPDFRSARGRETISKKYGEYKPEDVLSHTFFMEHPAEFYRIVRTDIRTPRARPNRAHFALARMERDGKLKAVITQNADGLHTKAGSRIVHELHGSMHRHYCLDCGKVFDLSYIVEYPGPVPLCTRCQGIVRPDVVLYGEKLPREALEASRKAVAQADLFIVGGTSLVVHPAAGLVPLFKGKDLVIINHDPTPHDKKATLLFRDSIGEVLDAAWPERQATTGRASDS
jgi:NAD-dependent deacetylase